MNPTKTILFVLLFLTTFLASCEFAGEIALQVTGSVDQSKGWTEDQIKAMNTTEVTAKNKDGEEKKYTGVLIGDLLEVVKLTEGVTKVVFVSEDGSMGEVTLEELDACQDCIISFRNQGGFSIVMPGFPGKIQVKGVVEIQVE